MGTVSKYPFKAWSYSALTGYEDCPRRYFLTRVSKAVKEEESEAIRWGNFVHKALENRIRDKTPLPETIRRYEQYVSKLEKLPGVLEAEQKIALTENMEQVKFFDRNVWLRCVLDVSFTSEDGTKALVLDWKGLPLDTPIPTPSGWSTMGEIRVGDSVFGLDGLPSAVVGKSQVKTLPGYRLVFDDASTIECDNEHLWLTRRGVVPAPELRVGDSIPMPAPLELPERQLPIAPYVLGCWIGDGKHTGGEISKPDTELFDNIAACGYSVGADISGKRVDKCASRTVYGLRTELQRCGLLGNKHVPQEYLRAGITQRLELLRGLMDTDGTWNKARKQAVFTTCTAELAETVRELALSLGERATIHPHKSKGFGRVVDAFYVSWAPRLFNPFRLTRKAELVVFASQTGLSSRRCIRRIEPLQEVTTQCISVANESRTYLAGKQMVPTHNTGKNIPNDDQLDLFAAVGFTLNPTIQEVKAGYVMLKLNRIPSPVTYHREQLSELWQRFMPRVEQMKRAHAKADFPPRPSGLCRKWCPVGKNNCEFCGW